MRSLSHPTLLRSILVLCSNLSLGVPSSRLPLGFHTKTLYALPPPGAITPLHISSSLNWSRLSKNVSYKFHYVVFFVLQFYPSVMQIYSTIKVMLTKGQRRILY